MRLLLLACLALTAHSVMPAPDANAELIGPGTYQGWIVKDRWGEVALVQGVHRLVMSGDAKTKALEWLGKSVTVEVTKVGGSRGDFDPQITEVSSIKAARPKHDGVMRIVLQQPEIDPPVPHQQHFDVYVRYTGKERFRLQCKRVKVIVRRRGPPINLGKVELLKGEKDIWTCLEAKDKHETPWVRAGASMDALEIDKRIEQSLVLRAPGGEFEGTGAFTYRADLMFELPPGEYEFVALLGDDNYSHAPTPRSRVTSFDVVKPKR